MFQWERFAPCLGSVLLAGMIGCGSSQPAKPPPPTQAVEGIVLRKDGKPAPGGGIEFRHVTKPEFISLGTVDEGGKFKLRTIGGTADATGAQEGEHTVIFTPRSAKQEEMVPVILTKKYMIKSGENNLVVQLEK